MPCPLLCVLLVRSLLLYNGAYYSGLLWFLFRTCEASDRVLFQVNAMPFKLG